MNLKVIELFPCFLPSKQNYRMEMEEIINKGQTQRDIGSISSPFVS